MKTRILTGMLTLGLATWGPLACSDEGGGNLPDGQGNDNGSGTGNSPSVGTGNNSSVDDANGDGGLDFGTGGVNGSGGAGQLLDGGLVDLTPEQVDSIQNAECTGANQNAELVPSVLQLVVDISLSMDDEPPGDSGGESKWEITRDALLSAIASLPPTTAVGLQLYPQGGGGPGGGGPGGGGPGGGGAGAACVTQAGAVAIEQLGPVDSAQRQAISTRLNQADPNNYTPTHDAYHFALTNSLEPYEGDGKKFMLLITDGAPTQSLGCTNVNIDGVSPRPIIDAISTAYASGVNTFIIGSPGSEMSRNGDDMRPWLSEAAFEGGTGADGCAVDGPNYCHFDMTTSADFAASLTEGLAKIAGQVVDSCTFEVPQTVGNLTVDRNATNVILQRSNGSFALVLRDDQGECNEGWVWGPTGELILCPATCEAFKLDPQAEVSLSIGCNPFEVIPR